MEPEAALDLTTVKLVEELAANAWAPFVVQAYGAWRLRATFGITKRANSAWTVGPLPGGDWRGNVESFYRRRGLAPCFYISDATPSGVTSALAEAGYEPLYPGYFMIGSVRETLERTAADDRFAPVYAENADDRWIADFIRLEGFEPARAPAYAHIFGAIGPVRTFLRLVDADGALVGLATGVAERGWVGVSNVIVAPDRRRQGVAAQLLRALAAWAEREGASRLWLQVVESNEPAIALYRKVGFDILSRFHYRQAR
ncbi:GNAT family N-acetyltransferase [Paenibacillus sp.]|uniref:GNAT family N-acetyltransferase n=1 Tax=Paenibacillus sp. TaxID=58172 RepID=UPI002D58CA80|nr:GNAT family N-acetyltransferase [Paenibacillus sp.]HZG83443.1 GNAT family N-acetyltransferase [Paenibacillus sp.]